LERDREIERQKDDRKTDRKTSKRQRTHFYPETAVGHIYEVIDVYAEVHVHSWTVGHNHGVIDVYAEVHVDGAKEIGATIVREKKNYEIFKVS
jgi:hypothetical protein